MLYNCCINVNPGYFNITVLQKFPTLSTVSSVYLPYMHVSPGYHPPHLIKSLKSVKINPYNSTPKTNQNIQIIMYINVYNHVENC